MRAIVVSAALVLASCAAPSLASTFNATTSNFIHSVQFGTCPEGGADQLTIGVSINTPEETMLSIQIWNQTNGSPHRERFNSTLNVAGQVELLPVFFGSVSEMHGIIKNGGIFLHKHKEEFDDGEVVDCIHWGDMSGSGCPYCEGVEALTEVNWGKIYHLEVTDTSKYDGEVRADYRPTTAEGSVGGVVPMGDSSLCMYVVDEHSAVGGKDTPLKASHNVGMRYSGSNEATAFVNEILQGTPCVGFGDMVYTGIELLVGDKSEYFLVAGDGAGWSGHYVVESQNPEAGSWIPIFVDASMFIKDTGVADLPHFSSGYAILFQKDNLAVMSALTWGPNAHDFVEVDLSLIDSLSTTVWTAFPKVVTSLAATKLELTNQIQTKGEGVWFERLDDFCTPGEINRDMGATSSTSSTTTSEGQISGTTTTTSTTTTRRFPTLPDDSTTSTEAAVDPPTGASPRAATVAPVSLLLLASLSALVV
eukprot:Selendium_serpulae@DN10211_c0_g1_i1.p1